MSLGERQKAVLRCLRDLGPYPGGWFYENRSTTLSVLDGLVKRGLAERARVAHRYGEYNQYRITDLGREQEVDR